MLVSGLITLGSSIVGGISNYFKTKQEIKKVKVEADKEVIVAEAKAKVARLQKESEQDFTLDQQSQKNMQTSWKDELLLIVWLIPLVLCFIPDYQVYVKSGFEALNNTPDWYQYILIGMVVVIYGMRGLLKIVLEIILKRFTK